MDELENKIEGVDNAPEAVDEEVFEPTAEDIVEETLKDSLTDEDVPSKEETDITDSPLEKELEQIRDMFQQAIDEAEESGEELNPQEIIQELEEIEEPEDTSAEKEMPVCECCGEAPASKYFGEGYPYCDNCRELMKRYPLRAGGIIAILAMIIVFGLSIYLGANSLEASIHVLEAQEHLAVGEVFTALQSMYSFTSNGESDSRKAEKILIECYQRSGYISDAAKYIEKVFTEKELGLPWNKKYKKAVEETELFIATKEKADVIVSKAFTGGDFDYDKVMAELDALSETPVKEGEDTLYSKAFITYYKSEVMRINGESPAKQLELLESLGEKETEGYEWIYYTAICTAAAKSGNEEKAKEYFEKIKKINSQDMNAYISFANYYRFLPQPDGDAILKLCEEAKKHAYNNDSTYYPTLAIGYLIKGEGALAFETMQEFMASGYYTVSNCNLYALCALYCGNTEVYESMKQVLENSGYTLDELITKYEAGKISIDEIIADKGGNVA